MPWRHFYWYYNFYEKNNIQGSNITKYSGEAWRLISQLYSIYNEFSIWPYLCRVKSRLKKTICAPGCTYPLPKMYGHENIWSPYLYLGCWALFFYNSCKKRRLEYSISSDSRPLLSRSSKYYRTHFKRFDRIR